MKNIVYYLGKCKYCDIFTSLTESLQMCVCISEVINTFTALIILMWMQKGYN